jgi:hypothetical protein
MTTEPEEMDAARRPFPGLAMGLVAAIAVAVAFAFLWNSERTTSADEVDGFLSDRKARVEEVTSQVVDLLINYDSETLAERSDSVLPLATGSFREEYERLVGEGLGEALEEAGASSEGEIVDGPDVSFTSSSQAQALVTTRQTTSSQDNPNGVTFLYVMRITLVNSDGWKADDVEILSRQTVSS